MIKNLTVKVLKVGALPGILQPNSLYFVSNGDYAEAYFTDLDGNPKKVGNSTMIAEVSTSTVTADKTYLYEQSTPSTIWVITHNLNKHPSVTVIDTAGTEVKGQVDYIDKNNLFITFNAGFSGTATLN